VEAETGFGLNVLAGSGGNVAIEKTISFSLEVLPAADFFCELVPLSQAVRHGRVANYSLTIRSLNDFAGTVDVTLEGLTPQPSWTEVLAAGEETTIPVAIPTLPLSPQAYSLTLRIVGTEE
jgi:hypothetical protein